MQRIERVLGAQENHLRSLPQSVKTANNEMNARLDSTTFFPKEKRWIIEGFLCKMKERARSLLNVSEELALWNFVQKAPIRRAFTWKDF